MLALPICRSAFGDIAHDRLLELTVFLARPGATLGDLRELLLCLGDIALLQIALAEIFPRAQIVWIERERPLVIVEALVGVAELARGVADMFSTRDCSC